MNVLIVGDENQIICRQAREDGFNAYTVSNTKCTGNHPEWHIQADWVGLIEPAMKLDGTYSIIFGTCDDKIHEIPKWDAVRIEDPIDITMIAWIDDVLKRGANYGKND